MSEVYETSHANHYCINNGSDVAE